jgi:tetratricopeptide (TPR) repeat protein
MVLVTGQVIPDIHTTRKNILVRGEDMRSEFPCMVAGAMWTLAALLSAGPAQAQSQNLFWCAGKDSASDDQQISGCTVLLREGGYPRETQAAQFYNRGQAYGRKGQSDRAIEDFTQAIRLKPNYASAYVSRGRQYVLKGQDDRAIQDFNQAIKVEPNPSDNFAFYNRAGAYHRKNQIDRAIQDYDYAIRVDPDDASALYYRGNAKLGKGDSAGGNADIAKAKAIQPNIGQ